MNEKLSTSVLNSTSSQREPSVYVGGEVRNLTEANNIHLVLAFEGANYKESLPLLIAEQILGNGRKLGRLQQRVLNKNVFIDGAQALNVNYSDTGLFGIKLSGASSHAKEILNVAANTIVGLKDISVADVELAKQSLKARFNLNNACTARRLEDRTKALYYLGRTNENVSSEIDGVTLEQVQAAVSKSLRSPLTFVARGG